MLQPDTVKLLGQFRISLFEAATAEHQIDA
jgi:hypothetical protein